MRKMRQTNVVGCLTYIASDSSYTRGLYCTMVTVTEELGIRHNVNADNRSEQRERMMGLSTVICDWVLIGGRKFL